MTNMKAYLVGGGLASLAGAAYLIKDGGIPGEKITIYEESGMVGGSLDAEGIGAGDGYVMRGYRMLESKVYSCLYDLLSFIPSLHDPDVTVLDEIREFNERVRINAKSRLISKGKILEPFPFQLQLKDRFRLLWVLTRPDKALSDMTIEDYFSSSFFNSNFWLQFCTTFSFQPWHSLVELKRYLLRFYHVAPQLSSMECVQLAPYNEYESIVLPLSTWLRHQGVRFELDVQVIDLEFKIVDGIKTVRRIHCLKGHKSYSIEVDKQDQVFATLGSMTANSSIGSMDTAPKADMTEKDPSWLLWENIARQETGFGTPSVFNNDIEKSKWTSFSITFRDPFFIDHIQLLTGNETGTEGLITITDSNWLISFAMTPYPYFKSQPEHVSVCWGYGLLPEEIGNYVNKKMTECTGKEILIELCSHLGLQLNVDHIVETSTCIPCLMPYITSQFLPRTEKDRPQVVTKDIANLALLGQYCEIPDDISFTLEYSVRTAQTGVYKLLHLEKDVSPIYKGYKNPRHIYSAVKTAMRPKVSGAFSRHIEKRLSRAAMALIGLADELRAVMLNRFRSVRMGTGKNNP